MNTSSSFPTFKLRTATSGGPFGGFSGWGAGGSQTKARSFIERAVSALLAGVRGVTRSLGLMLVTALALADGVRTHLVATQTNSGRARARAAWLHRWSRLAQA